MFSSRKILFGCILLVGIFIPCVFAVDVSKSLSQEAQDTFSSQDIFAGDIVVGNLYKKQLRLVQHNEVTSTDTAVKGIVNYYARQWCRQVTSKDILAILSDAAPSFDVVVQQVLPPLTQKDVFAAVMSDRSSSMTSSSSIDSSASLVTLQRAYAHVFSCKAISTPMEEDYTALQREVSSLYYQFLSSSFLTTNISQDNYGEDLFWNGNSDDSQFDLLVDVQSIGNLFFTTFQTAPQVLFYQLPQRTAYEAAQQKMADLGISSSPPVTSFTAPLTTYIGPRRTFISPSVWDTTVSASWSVSLWSSAIVTSSLRGWSLGASLWASADKDIEQFVSATNIENVSSDFNFVLWNQCVSGASLPAPLRSTQEEAITPQEYLSGISSFLDTVSVQDLVDKHLLSGFEARYAGISWSFVETSPWSSSSTSPSSTDYSQQGFVWSQTSTCDAQCRALPLDKQFACQQSCAKSCIKTCDGLPLDEKVLCVNDCACFMVSGPTGPGWKNIENMFSMKFCTEPVQAVYFQRGKTVSSLQWVYNELSTILRWLKASGQTTKFTKSKEALDGNILTKFAEAIDFRINITFKALFPQSSSSTLLRARQQDNEKLVQATLGISAADDYNKYIVLSDVAQYNADSEPSSSYEQTQANVQKFTALSAALQPSSQDTVSLYQQQKYVFLMDDMLSFLQSHQQFWEYTFTSLVDIAGYADTLEQKIKKSQ